MRLTWTSLALLATLALAGCSEPVPPATVTPALRADTTATPRQMVQSLRSANETDPTLTTQSPTLAADLAEALPPTLERTAAASPTKEASALVAVPVAEPMPELAPMPVPTPPAATPSPLPEFVPGTAISPEDIYNFTDVSAGYDHSCGLRSDGTVLCWGDGRNGETEPPEGTFTEVSAGDGYTRGIKTDGSVACWGIWGITYGMPILDTNTAQRPDTPTGTFKSISTGNAHACGIKADDTIECWGENRVSAGDFAHHAGQAEPPPGTFLSVSAGGSTNCGVTSGKQVVCWGAGYEGAESPVEGQFLSVSAGGWHSFGVRIDNTVVCWGDDSPDGTETPNEEFASVSVGGYHTCGVTTAGALECWGSYIKNPAPQGEFRSVSVAGNTRCAVRSDGAIACWGHDFWFHKLGLKARITCGVLPNRDTVCPGEEGYDLLATVHASDWVQYYEQGGSTYPCGNGEDGAVVCWDPYLERFVDPTPRKVVEFRAFGESACWLFSDGTVGCWGPVGSPKGTFRSVAVGDGIYGYFACGVRTDDELACWGDNGHNSGNIFPPKGAFKSVSPGFIHGCAISMDDSEECWGRSSSPDTGMFRSLGGGGVRNHCGIRVDNTLDCWGGPPALSGTFKSVSMRGLPGSHYIYCAVRTDGRVACSGTDNYGTTSPPEGKFQSVSVGGDHVCGVRTDGIVACWGNNTYDGKVTGQADPPPGQFLSVSAGGLFTCGIRTDHTLACWGRVPEVLKNLSGIKPPPATAPISTPTPDIWALPLRVQLEWEKQQPGNLVANVGGDVDRIYRFVGMMTEAEREAMVDEAQLLLEELGPPKGKARTHTYAWIWLDLLEAFESSLDEFNNTASISEFRLQVPFYVYLPSYLPSGFRHDGLGTSGGSGSGDDATGWTIHFSRSSEWYPQLESGTYERITFLQSTNDHTGNPFRKMLPQIGGGEKIELPNLEAAGVDNVRYWLAYSEWGAGGKSQYYQVAWEDPETDSFTHVISSLSLEETLKVVGSIR